MMPIMTATIADRRPSTQILQFDPRGAIIRHRERTEDALREIREDASLTDVERVRRVTEVLAEANARALALWNR